MNERIDKTPCDPRRLLEHLRHTAARLGAGFSEERVRRTLEVFDEEFRGCVVQLKAASKPGSSVFYRFFYNGEKDLTAIAQRAGMIPPGQAPMVDLQHQVLARFEGATRAGLDFDSASGLAKVWTYTGGPQPVELLHEIPALPESVRRHARFFEKHGLRDVYFVCSDYTGRTMNVYFGWDPTCRNPEWLRRLIAETGGAPLPDSIIADILESQAMAGGVGTTFSWDHPDLLRWCVYSLEIPYGQGSHSQVRLPALPQRLALFRSEAPTLNDEPQYNVAWSFGQAGHYLKLEKSYARDATYFLTCEMGGDLSHPGPASVVAPA